MTKIEWTEETWNPTTGCDRVSPGCDNCYALTMAARLKGMGQAKYQRDGDPRTSGPGFGVAEHPGTLQEPLTWRKPRRVFVDSMGDLFHDDVSDAFIWSVFVVMAQARRHTFQVLTKRHGRMRSLLNRWAADGWIARDHRMSWNDLSGYLVDGALPNVWLGVSVEDQKRADLRIPALLQTPAAVRFLSCEPLLGAVDLTPWVNPDACEQCDSPCVSCPWDKAVCLGEDFDGDTGHQPVRRVDWVIVGGESGPNARPMHPDWARQLRDQCVAGGVSFFLKQHGEWGPAPWSLRVCDPDIGWQGTPEGLARAKVDAELQGATHCVLPDGSLYKAPHKVWSLERVGEEAGAVRRWGKARSGRELDGRTWDEFPTPNRAEVHA